MPELHITIAVRPIESRGCTDHSALPEWAGSGSVPVDADSADPSGFCGDRTDELLTRAVIEALAAGRSWAQIATQLGVPPPSDRDNEAVTDHERQEAIVAHENARAARRHDQT
ncbi:hypothetical protein ACFVJ3_43215 [Rhodococcus sp. NPDC127593]|uniref:hypothetical protein n=1 Tax=Rhodococcus sp. NPDC127593 TaxID=3345404 RepID=UPI0036409674